MRVWKDKIGIYIKDRMGEDNHYRPGDVNGWSHAYDQSDGRLQEGMKVKSRHMTGAPGVKITLDDGRVLVWCSEWKYRQSR
jgi:hypothetical protein